MGKWSKTEHEAWPPGRTHPGFWSLWGGILLGPIAFLLHLQLNYMLVPAVCQRDLSPALLHIPAIVMLGVTLFAAWLAFGNRRRFGAGAEDESGATARARFMSLVGMFTSTLFVAVMVAQWIPIFMIGPCVRV